MADTTTGDASLHQAREPSLDMTSIRDVAAQEQTENIQTTGQSLPPTNEPAPARKTPPGSLDIDKSKPEDFEGQLATDNEVPSPQTIKSIENYIVLDSQGKSRTFKSLYSGPNCSRRVLVIFVRHFFCGMCQDFIRSLCEVITTDALLTLPISTFITIIGCGDPSLIDMYARETKCPFPIYTDPKRTLFTALGMTKTLNAGTQPEYSKRSFLKNAIDSTLLAVKHIPKGQGFKSGDKRQVGGEFLFEPFDLFTPPTTPYEGKKKPLLTQELGREGEDLILGEKHVEEHSHRADEDKRVTWCHRMKTTRDHSELEELKEVLGLEQDSDKDFERKGTGLTMASKMSELSASLAASQTVSQTAA